MPVNLNLNRFTIAPVAALFLFAAVAAHAQPLTVSSYSYIVNPNSLYPDTGGVELTDGVDQTIVWGQGISGGSINSQSLSGWRDANPSVQFSFGSVVDIGAVRVWAADSDGFAGVYLPLTLTIRTPDSSFSLTHTVVNPAGNGSTVPIDITGFSVRTNALILQAARGGEPDLGEWAMFSEVRFTTAPVPEPSTTALAFAGIAVAAWRIRSARRTR
jgi:hypothetical protein